MERIRMRNGFDYISQYVLSICSLLMSEAKAHNVEEEGISPLWFGTRFGTYATTHNCPGLCTSCTCIMPFDMVTPKSLFICNKSQEALSIPLLPTMCASCARHFRLFSRAWYHKLKTFRTSPAFFYSSLFIQNTGTDPPYLLVYVDDILITGNHSHHISSLRAQFSIR